MVGLVAAMEARGGDGVMLERMLGYMAQRRSIVESIKGLGPYQAMDMLRFALGSRGERASSTRLAWQFK